jgi:hypothetical protein
MPKLDDIHVRKKEASSQVSAQTRSLALGYLGISWALLTAHDEPLRSMAANVSKSLLVSLAAGSFPAIFCDFWQYVALRRMVNNAADLAETAKEQVALYNEDSWEFRTQKCLYQAKIWIVVSSTLLLIAIFFRLLAPTQTLPSHSGEQKCPPASTPSPNSAAVK